MNQNDIKSLFEKRQSCRKYDGSKKVSAEVLEGIAGLAALAPSACNSQPWKFYCVNQAEKVKDVAAATRPFGMNGFTENCTAFIAITQTTPNLTERAGVKMTGRDFVANDIGIACAHLVLAAESYGVNSCILGMFNEDKIKKLLDIPEAEKVSLVVALGYADKADVIRPKKRKDLSSVAKFFVE